MCQYLGSLYDMQMRKKNLSILWLFLCPYLGGLLCASKEDNPFNFVSTSGSKVARIAYLTVLTMGAVAGGAAGPKRVEYVGPELWEVELAWATTVHKAQGSESKAVVVVLSPGQRPLLTRRLLYTGPPPALCCCFPALVHVLHILCQHSIDTSNWGIADYWICSSCCKVKMQVVDWPLGKLLPGSLILL